MNSRGYHYAKRPGLLVADIGSMLTKACQDYMTGILLSMYLLVKEPFELVP